MSIQMKEEKEVPVKATRNRKLTTNPIYVWDNYEIRLHFDNHLAMWFRFKEESSEVRVTVDESDPPFGLNEFSEPWKVVMRWVVRSTDEQNKIIHQVEMELSNERPSMEVSNESFKESTVQFELEFLELEGLGVKPLRNYSVSNSLSDVTLLAGGQTFFMNKGFLATHSPYFEEILFADRKQNVFKLEDVSAATFTDLLDLISHEMIYLHKKEEVLEVLNLASRFEVSMVIGKLEHMLLTLPNIGYLNHGEKLWAADKYGMKALLMRCLSQWSKGDMEKFLTPDMCQQLRPSTFALLLKKFA